MQALNRLEAEIDPRDPARTTLLLGALAIALLVLSALRPPEMYPWGIAGCRLLLVAATCLMWRGSMSRPLLPRFMDGLLPLALAAMALASCRARALDEAFEATTLVLAAILGIAVAHDRRVLSVMAGLLVVLGSIAALLAILQHHVTYKEELEGLLSGPGSPSPYVIARLRDGRPSGLFSLPAALGGFLALTLPLTLWHARSTADRWQRAATLAATVLQLYALLLTRSVGGLAVTALSVVLTLPLLTRGRLAIPLALVPLLALLVAFLFLHERRAELQVPGGDPLSLRAGNWRAAGEMIRDHPLFGVGPGSFGTFYPRYMRPGMNETRYAHNSYLQLMAGWGVWSLLPPALLALVFAARLRRALRLRSDDLPWLAAGASFLAHNLVDFTAYLPGVAIPAALVIGVSLGGERKRPGAGSSPGRRHAVGWRTVLAAGILVLFAGHAVATARARSLIEQARLAALEPGGTAEALDLARLASSWRPDDPVPRGFIAEWVLSHGMDDPVLRREGEREAERAVRLDRESAILHHDLSLYLLQEREIGPAFRERFSAHRLFPLKDDYRFPETPLAEVTDP
jgi:O-antigen ligase